MSQYEDDAGLFGDYLADLVKRGKLTDAVVLAYFAGNNAAAERVNRACKEDVEVNDSPEGVSHD